MDFAAALQNADIQFEHHEASVAPALSRDRCTYICEWLLGISEIEPFAHPVQWQALGLSDYPAFVPCPMDITTVKHQCAGASHTFVEFLLKIRLVFANACRYNPPDHPYHILSRKLAAVFERKVRVCQQFRDEAKEELSAVFLPLAYALEQRDAELRTNARITDITMSWTSIIKCIEHQVYVTRHDIIDDFYLKLGQQTSVKFLCDKRCEDLTANRLIHPHIRQQLAKNIQELRDARLLEVYNFTKQVNPHCCPCTFSCGCGIDTCRGMLCIDSLNGGECICIDAFVRQQLVKTS